MGEDLHRQAAERAYEAWMREPGVGAAWAGDSDVEEGFIAGYLARAAQMEEG